MSELFYHDFNSSAGRTCVLIHGLGANSNMWQFQWPELVKAGYRVIVPDIRGFGNTPYNRRNSVQSMARDIYDLLVELNINKASIIGLSMGGAIAMQFALEHKETVEKLVVANSAARFANKVGALLYMGLRYVLLKIIPRETGAMITAKFLFPNPAHGEFRKEFARQILQASTKGFMETVQELMKYNLREKVKNISAPTLIIGSEHDFVTPNFLQNFLHEQIAGSKLAIIENSGHISAVDSSEKFNSILIEFLN